MQTSSYRPSLRSICLIALIGCLFANTLSAQDSLLSKSDIVKLDFNILTAKKTRIQSKDPSLLPAYQRLLTDADRLLSYGPVSVMDKTGMPPSGSRHDYMSIAPYFWPDPSKPDGLPYINKDGQVNPEVRQFQDKQNFPKLCGNVYTLSLAYFFSHDEKYARHASKLLQVWFLDSATKMNPNLNYGQAVKGVTPGRAAGLIDSRFIIWALDAVDLLQHSTSWTTRNQADMKKWCAGFLGWLQTNKIGIDEMNADNNHGVWYDAQCLAMAVFIDSTALADKIVLRTADRLDKQMDSTGLFPRELTRTTSLHYSVFILNAFYIVAQLSERTHTDLWTFQTASGKSLQKATTAILPYLLKEKEWTGPQIHPFGFPDAVPLLLRSMTHYSCLSCGSAIGNIEGSQNDQIVNLL
jgi:Alginate lyase